MKDSRPLNSVLKFTIYSLVLANLALVPSLSFADSPLPRSSLSITGSAKKRVAPNNATLTFILKSSADTSAQAMSNNRGTYQNLSQKIVKIDPQAKIFTTFEEAKKL